MMPLSAPVPQFPAPEPLGPVATLIRAIIFTQFARLYPLPDDIFDIFDVSEWLTPEQRNALEALSSR